MGTKKAFTLAEVLITLTVVGVVAALLLPVLNNKIGDYALQNQRKKAQNVLSNGIKMILANESELSLENTALKKCGSDSDCLASEVQKTFKLIADNNSKNELFTAMYTFGNDDVLAANSDTKISDDMLAVKERTVFNDRLVEKSRYNDNIAEILETDLSDAITKVQTETLNSDYAIWQDAGMNYVFVTSDGMIFGIMNNDKSDSTLTILADVNGGKGPNAGGRDLCTYNISGSGIVAETCSSTFIPTVETKIGNKVNSNDVKQLSETSKTKKN